MLAPNPHQYADYYEGDVGAGYPLPTKERQGVNLPRTLITGAALLLAFPIVHRLATRGLGAASRGAARLASRHSRRLARVSGRLAQAGQASPTLGKLVRQTSTVDNMARGYRRWQRGAGIDMSAYTRWATMSNSGYAQMSATNTEYMGRVSNRMAKFGAFFKDRHTAAFRGRVAGSVEGFMRDYATRLPPILLASKAIGMVTSRRDEAGPAWWNLPAHVKDMAGDMTKSAIAYLPISLAFRGIPGAVKLTKDTLEYGMRGTFSGIARASGGGATMQHHLYNTIRRVERTRERAIGVEGQPGIVSRIRGSTKEFFHSFSIKSRGRRPSPVDTAISWWRNLHTGWERGAIKSYKPLTQIPPGNFIGRLAKITDAPVLDGLMEMRGVPLTGNSVTALLSEAFKSHSKPRTGFLARIAGLRPRQFTAQTVEEVIERVHLQNLRPELQQPVTEWLQSRYYGRGVFDAGGGRTLNLGHWRPTDIISRAVDWGQEKFAFRMPGAVLKPLEIFRAKRLKNAAMGKAPDVYEWTEGHRVRVGPLPQEQTRLIGGSYSRVGATIALQPGERMLWVKQGSSARGRGGLADRLLGGGGRIMFIRPEGESQRAVVLPHTYKLVEEPLHGSTRRIQDMFYGSRASILDRFDSANYGEEIERLQEAYGWSKLRAWWHSRVLRNPSSLMLENMRGRKPGWGGLEIGAGYNTVPGPLTRTRNLFMKYFRPDSPLVYMSEERGFLTELAKSGAGPHNYVNSRNLQPTIQFVRGARNALNESLDEAWHILRRREVYGKYASHRVSIPGWEGAAPTLGDLFGDTPAGRGKLVTAVRNLLETRGYSELPGPWEKARHILDTVQSDEGYWTHAITRSPRGKELTAADELRKFVFRHHIINEARSRRNYKYLQSTLGDINIGRRGLLTNTNRELTLLRNVDNLAHVEERLGEMGLSGIPDVNDPNFRRRLGERFGIQDEELYDRLNSTVDYLMGERKPLAELSRIFQPPHSAKLPNILQAPIYSRSTTTSPYEVVVAAGFPSVAADAGRAGLLRGIKSVISPRYMSKVEGIPMPHGQPLTNPARFLTEATMRFERMSEGMGLGLNLGRRTTYTDIWGGVFSRMVVPGIALYSGYQAMDTFFDVNPMFGNTALDEGLTVALAEQHMKHNLRVARLMDISGVTSTARYLEGLMPGLMSSPAARIGRVVGPPLTGAAIGGLGGPTGAGIGMFIGAGAGLMGINDVTRTREELEDIYSGRQLVPVRKGSGWLFGRQSLGGGRISYFRPSWFARTKSQYQYTPDLYGSKLESFMFRNPMMMPFSLLLDPYHWERKSYFSSPYPETGGLLESVPFAGPTLSATVGRAIKPVRMMHRKQLERSFQSPASMGGSDAGAGYHPPPGIQVNVPSPFAPATLNELNATTGTQVRRPYPVSMHSMRQTIGRQFYRSWVEPMGLFGWATELAAGGHHPFDSDVVMANAGERVSARRDFWSMINGGHIGGITEFPRRFYPRMRKQIERWNPLRSRMPGWLGGGLDNEYFLDFSTGDPFLAVEDGHLRLPGWGNMAAYHTTLSMPFRASQLGKTYEEMVQYITGTRPPATVEQEEYMETGTILHRMVQDELRRANLLVKAEAPVFEPYSNITGSVDAIVRQGRRNVAMEFKTTGSEKLAQMARPDRAHISQLNFYLKGLGLREGFIIYLDRDNPTLTRTFPVQYSQALYRSDIARLGQARATAGKLLNMGYGHPGEAYSHLDRLRVLGDVALYSQKYKDELKIVNQMDKMGLLSPEEHMEKIDIVKRRRSMVRTYDLYPRRFDLGGIFHPDESYQQMSENEHIKAAAEYNFAERVGGALWETLTHQRTPFHSKMLGMYTPREQYERFSLYGRRSSFWNEPVRDFVEPYMRATMATRKPGEGIVRGLQAGFLFGGPPGAAVGAGALGVYGAVQGGYRWLTDSTYIPGNVQRKWEIAEYFDNLKYLKARRLFQMTGEEDYSRMMGETMVGINPLNRNRQSFTDIARAVPYELRSFIFAFMKETDPGERDRIAAEVPTNVAQLLRIKWAQADQDGEAADRYADDFRSSRDLTTYYQEHRLPEESWMGWHPSVELGDVQMKTMEKLGMDAHTAGFGWYDQVRRIKYSPLTPEAIDIHDPTRAEVFPELSLDRNEVTNMITGILKQFGASNIMVNTNVTPGVGSRVTLNASIDRSAEIQAQLGVEMMQSQSRASQSMSMGR